MTLSLAAQEKKPLPMPWSRIQRVLDAMEARFVRGALRLQEARVQALRPLVERVLETGLVPADIPLEGSFPALVADFAAEVLVEGLVHASADVRASEWRARAAGVELKVDGGPVVPKEALAFLESRRDLARFFDPDQVDKVRTILGNSLREGATVKQTMDALQTALPAASRARLENIARTEATAAYNQGRLYRFLQSKGFIVAVQFMATLDSRVTDICEHRDGLVFSLKDPRIRENTPPLHFQCRSILSPVSGYELEELGGQERLDKDARTMDDAPGVQVTKKGRFGNEPWPDTPGGAAPVPRAKPVGPKAGGGESPRPKAQEDQAAAPEPGAKGGGAETEPPVGTKEGGSRGGYTHGELPAAESPESITSGGRKFMGPDLESGASQNSKTARAGKRYIGPNGMKSYVDSSDFQRVLDLYKTPLQAGLLPGLDAKDIEIVFRYVDPAGSNSYVLERILQGGLDGLALLIHEAEELRGYFKDGRFNPWKREQQKKGYDWYHGGATIAEHRFLFQVARQKGYSVDSLWDILRTDENAMSPETPKHLWIEQIQSNLVKAEARSLEDVPAPNPLSLAEAKRFWQDVMAGRLQIEHVDFSALQDDRRP